MRPSPRGCSKACPCATRRASPMRRRACAARAGIRCRRTTRGPRSRRFSPGPPTLSLPLWRRTPGPTIGRAICESEDAMRPNRILHPELAKAVATLGHQDILLVTDAGFPIPADAWRIDLGFYAGLPDVLDVLRVLRQEVFVEEVHFAGDILTKNKPLYAALQQIYTGSGADFKLTTHEQLIADTAHRAKVIVRSGSLNP